jgi:hypothetical protein
MCKLLYCSIDPMIEIDGVIRELEQPVSDSGDLIADMYTRAIDLSTAPYPLGEKDTDLLASSLRRLNRNLATASFYLSGSDCVEPYNNVAMQLNDINAQKPDLEELRPLMSREETRGLWSPRFKFRDYSHSDT